MLYRIQSRHDDYQPPPGATLSARTTLALEMDHGDEGDAICGAFAIVAPAGPGDAIDDHSLVVEIYVQDDAGGPLSVLSGGTRTIEGPARDGKFILLPIVEEACRRRPSPLRVAFLYTTPDAATWHGAITATIEPAVPADAPKHTPSDSRGGERP